MSGSGDGTLIPGNPYGSFKDQLKADLDNVFFNVNEFAELAIYTPAGGQAKTVAARINYGDPEESGLPGMDSLNTEAMMEIRTDATNGIPQVAANDMVTIGADAWRVIYGNKTGDGLIWRCRITRSTR